MAEALANPKLDAARRTSLFLSIAGDRSLRRDAQLRPRAGRGATASALLPEIRALFEALKNEGEGVAEATIETALPLPTRSSPS